MDISKSAPNVQPAKFSRYRSVRKAAEDNHEAKPPLPQAPAPNSQIARRPSRYHRSPPNHTPLPLPIPSNSTSECASIDPANAISRSSPSLHTQTRLNGETVPAITTPDDASTPLTTPTSQTIHLNENERKRMQVEHNSRKTAVNAGEGTCPSSAHRSYEVAKDEARLILEGQQERLERLRHQNKSTGVNSWRDAPRNIGVSKSSKRMNTVRSAPASGSSMNENITPKKSKGARGWNICGSCTGSAALSSPEQPVNYHVKQQITVNQPLISPTMPEMSKITLQPQNQRLLDTSNPIVDTGERCVEIRYHDLSLTLAVTPTTSVQDLLNTASKRMSEAFDPRTYVLVEQFPSQGFERPLRRYECVHNVLLSWDSDQQNYLLLAPEVQCTLFGSDQKEGSVPQSSNFTFRLYHSQEPDRWDKLWIILRADGQVVASQHEDDCSSASICHLSDFDIYTPIQRQAKDLIAPKKYCFALKSQQGLAMLPESADLVHYFATNEKEIAEKWYQAVRSWRSRYLGSSLRLGQEALAKVAGMRLAGDTGLPVFTNPQGTAPYQLGASKPLLKSSLDVLNLDGGLQQTYHTYSIKRGNSVNRPLIDSATNKGSPGRIGSSFVWPSSPNAPVSTFPRKNTMIDVDDPKSTAVSDSERAFTGKGLLARSASNRVTGGVAHMGTSKPLIDLQATSDFTDGSLLRQIEAVAVSQGALEPKIDRQKRIEAIVPVSEGA